MKTNPHVPNDKCSVELPPKEWFCMECWYLLDPDEREAILQARRKEIASRRAGHALLLPEASKVT